MHNSKQKKIAVINDFCGFGRCSIAVSLPIISSMKIQCCPLPTSIFSNHTGFKSFYYTDFTERMESYSDEWKKLGLQFNGILVGFLASTEQIDIVTRFLRDFKTDDNITVIDPVMGDYGALYPTYSKELSERVKSLLPFADILTPNLTEACILTDTPYCEDMKDDEIHKIAELLYDSGAKKIVISGVEQGSLLVNFVYENGKYIKKIKTQKIGVSRSGTGDVFSSIIAADAVNGVDFVSSVNHAAEYISKTIKRTIELDVSPTDGICFEEYLDEITEGIQQ